MSQRINWKKYDESTGVPSLSKVNIENIANFFPLYVEQIEIGKFFNKVDNTIALHQEELDLLKQSKKGFLRKTILLSWRRFNHMVAIILKKEPKA